MNCIEAIVRLINYAIFAAIALVTGLFVLGLIISYPNISMVIAVVFVSLLLLGIIGHIVERT